MPLYVSVGKHFPDDRGEHFLTCGFLENVADALAAGVAGWCGDMVVRHKLAK